MKKIIAVIMIAALSVCLVSCGSNGVSPKKVVKGNTFVFEKEGFGGDFTITFNKDGTYEYYEGALSSFIGQGKWLVREDMLTMIENESGRVRHFLIGDNELIYMAEVSDRFIYVKVEGGDRFIAK